MACWNCGAAPRSEPLVPSLSPIAIDNLLATNDPPTEAGIPLIRDFISHGALRVDALNAQIDLLRAAMDRLIAERNDMADRVQKYPIILSPIRRVPSELVCEIFRWTLPHTKTVAGKAVEQPPWYLGHISRPWRDIALADPFLWNSIKVDDSSNVFAGVQTQLLRSANAPLVVQLQWMDSTPGFAPFVDALVTHSDRWESLFFRCDDTSYALLLDLIRPAKGRLSRLKRLEVNGSGFFGDLDPSDIFSIAPTLREVLLTDPGLGKLSPPLLLPWEQITLYRGVGEEKVLIEILRAASNLVDASLGILYDEDILDSPMLTLPHLRRLHLDRGRLLPHLMAPKLEYFSATSIDSILPFVHRSSCQLTTLVLAEAQDAEEPFRLPPQDLIALLHSTRSLRNLVLQVDEEEGNSRVVDAMTIRDSPDDLCPNLTYLAYGTMSGYSDFNTFGSRDPFILMIRSRLQPDCHCRLSCLRLLSSLPYDYDTYDDSDDVALQLLMDEGLDVRLLGHPWAFVESARSSFILE